MRSSPAFTLDLTTHRSARLLAWTTLLASAAIVPVFLTATSLGVRFGVGLCVSASLFLGYRSAGWLRTARSVDAIVWNADGRWFVLRGLQAREVRLRGDSWVNGFAMLLRWDAIDGREPRIAMPFTVADLEPGVFRRLSIRLRIDGLRAKNATDSLLA